MKTNAAKICVLAMLSAISYIVVVLGRIPLVLFLKYDPKDIVITIGGFLYGPLAALMITVVVSFAEMFTISENGPIGLLMNIISGASFACTAAFIYKRYRSMKGAVAGLAVAWIFTTAVMVLWNYLITPLYLNVPRDEVAKLLIPAFIPFNLIKGGLNAALTMLLYKPVKAALQSSRLMPQPQEMQKTGKANMGIVIASVFVIATCVLWVLVLNGRL
ncbi:MAG: ECF transporter S component [Oscillospiraceae bacterium]|nr:ECF transporter S component [Oscillospiraceae bacterium]